MTNRGMIKWQPFSAVIPGNIIINEVLKQKNKIKMPILSEDQIFLIEEKILDSFYKQTPIKIKYYKNYSFYIKEGIISKIDTNFKKITINNKSELYFKQIIEIY